MSDTIPKLWTGDRVRVMDTTEMQQRSLANQRGIVIVAWSERKRGESIRMARVQLERGAVTLAAESLMREP